MSCTRRRVRFDANPFVHPLDVELLDLAEGVRNDWTVWAFEHITGCAACACRYGRVRASLS